MIYYIGIDILHINIMKLYNKLVSVINKEILDEFIDNCADPKDNQFVNINYVNNFKHTYPNEFEYIMKITNQKHV